MGNSPVTVTRARLKKADEADGEVSIVAVLVRQAAEQGLQRVSRLPPAPLLLRGPHLLLRVYVRAR